MHHFPTDYWASNKSIPVCGTHAGIFLVRKHPEAQGIYSEPHKNNGLVFKILSPLRDTPQGKLPSPVMRCLCLSSWYHFKEVIQAPGETEPYCTSLHSSVFAFYNKQSPLPVGLKAFLHHPPDPLYLIPRKED